MKKKLFFAAICMMIYTYFILAFGMISALNQNKLYEGVRAIKGFFIPSGAPKATDSPKEQQFTFNELGQLIHDKDKLEINKPQITPNTIVAFAFGQSNAGNSLGEKFKASTNNVINYWDGKYYVASDPLLGSSGWAGSVWTLLGNKLVEEKLADQVILITSGLGGTSIEEWRPDGHLSSILEAELRNIKKDNISITYFFWHQGERDWSLDPKKYEQGLIDLIKLTQSYFPNSKFFVSQASICNNESAPLLLQAQRNAAKAHNAYLGPNTDKIGLFDRYDRCHLSGRGAEIFAKQWVEVIKKQKFNEIN